jgi:predicted TIM-barrel fold metal-dependent hydrolase
VGGTAPLNRRSFLGCLGLGAGSLTIGGCGGEPPAGRFTQIDAVALERQRSEEAARAGQGPLGEQVYTGYRGLAELPWFGLDDRGRLVCTDDDVPASIDIHCHLGMSVLLAPDIDLQAPHPRTRHLLDCDGDAPPCRLDLDIYANGNFTRESLAALRWSTVAQGLWGSAFARTQTIPNLLAEMDAMRVERAFILPIKMGLPFGDDLTERWRAAILEAGAQARLLNGLSVHPHAAASMADMRAHASTGARLMKLHPTVQAFYPDEDGVMPLYEEAARLGLVVFFHGGRAGIEPASRQHYALVRHYEAVLSNFPGLPVILGHAGARDGEAMLELATRYDNAWLGLHGQSVTRLGEIISRTGGERLLFGTDWPFYHIGMSLAKVLLCTQGRDGQALRQRILRDNALALFPELAAAGAA